MIVDDSNPPPRTGLRQYVGHASGPSQAQCHAPGREITDLRLEADPASAHAPGTLRALPNFPAHLGTNAHACDGRSKNRAPDGTDALVNQDELAANTLPSSARELPGGVAGAAPLSTRLSKALRDCDASSMKHHQAGPTVADQGELAASIHRPRARPNRWGCRGERRRSPRRGSIKVWRLAPLQPPKYRNTARTPTDAGAGGPRRPRSCACTRSTSR